jgi:hypothetical protein
MAFGSKQGPDQVTTTRPVLTPQQQQLLDSAQGSVSATAPGQTGAETSAQDYWTQLVQQGGLAGRGLAGDASAFGQFTAPSMAMLQPMFDRMRQSAASRAGLATTSPFGVNARSGVELAASQQGINEHEAGMTYQNVQDTLNRLLQMQNFGMGAAGSLNQAGMFNRMLPMSWAQGRLGLLGPTGTESRTPTQSNWLSNVLGIGSIVAAPFTGGASLAMTPGLLNEGGAQRAPQMQMPDTSGIPTNYDSQFHWDPTRFQYGF